MKIIKKINHTLLGISNSLSKLQQYIDAIITIYQQSNDDKPIKKEKSLNRIYPWKISNAERNEKSHSEMIFDFLSTNEGKYTAREISSRIGISQNSVGKAAVLLVRRHITNGAVKREKNSLNVWLYWYEKENNQKKQTPIITTTTKMEIVYQAIKSLGKPSTVQEISKESGLTVNQVNSAVQNLCNKKKILSEPYKQGELKRYYAIKQEKRNLESEEIQENILYLLKQNKGKMMIGDISTFFAREFSRNEIETNCLALVRKRKLKPAVNQLYQLA